LIDLVNDDMKEIDFGDYNSEGLQIVE